MVAIRRKVGAKGYVVTKPLEKGKKVIKIDCSTPAKDEILDKEKLEAFEQYMLSKVKLHGQTGKLANKVKVKMVDNSLNIVTTMRYRKRYFKYLTKKFLKKKNLRDFLRILSNGKQGYTLKYFNIQDEEETA